MTNQEIAKAFLAQAELILQEAFSLRERQAWNLVVRRCQEVVELSLKAILRSTGIEIPHTHDVGFLFKQYKDRFPESFYSHIDRLVSISRYLRREREISFYGDEEIGAPPQSLYSEEDAKRALEDAKWVLAQCKGIIK